jgi:hypothetical protein
MLDRRDHTMTATSFPAHPQSMWKTLWKTGAKADAACPRAFCTRSWAIGVHRHPSFAVVVVGLVLATLPCSLRAQAPPASTLEVAPGEGAERLDGITALDTITLAEVERGQMGYGFSVFEGTVPERFDVEVVGVLRNFNPGISFIVGRLRGRGLEEIGVIAGMSGSPVYIDGRLAGAVGFSWDFSTGAVAFITPIDQMRHLSSLPALPPIRPVASLGDARNLLRLVERDGLRGVLDQQVEAVAAMLGGAGGAQGFEGARSSVQFAAAGFSAANRDLLGRALGAVAPSGTLHTDDFGELGPGSAVAAILVAGDFKLAASGTVTERRGDEVLAFGHPLFSLGPVSVPMAPAEVVTVVPSRLSSFKLTNVGTPIGAFDEDRSTGVRGRIGAVAPMMPVRLIVRAGGDEAGHGLLGGDHEYHLELADLPLLRPTLSATSVLQALDTAGHSSGDQGLDVTLRFDLGAHGELAIDQSFDGPSAGLDSALYLLQLVAFFELNDLEEIDIASIEVEATRYQRPRTATVERVVADRKQVRPGETIALRVSLVAPGGERSERQLEAAVPADARPGPLYLFVGDATSIDAVRLQIEPVDPANVRESLELLRSYHSRNGFGVLAARPARGVIVDGTALPDLPPSLRAVLQSPSAQQVKRLSLIIASESYLPAEGPIAGAARIDLEVLPASSSGERG